MSEWLLPQKPTTVGVPFELTTITAKDVNLDELMGKVMTTPFFWIEKLESRDIGTQVQWIAKITYFRSGQLPLPPLPGQTQKKIQIAGTKAFKEIEPKELSQELKASPNPEALPFPLLGVVLLVVGALLLLGGIGYFIWRHLKYRKSQTYFVKKNYNYKKVIDRFKSEVVSGEVNAENLRDRSFVCSELLRGYSEYTTKFEFLEMTADEIAKKQGEWAPLMGTKVDDEKLVAFYKKLEVMKYASHAPELSNPKEFFDEALGYIEKWHELESN